MTTSKTDLWSELKARLQDKYVVYCSLHGGYWGVGGGGYFTSLTSAGIVDKETAERWARKRSPRRDGSLYDEVRPALQEFEKCMGQDFIEVMRGT